MALPTRTRLAAATAVALTLTLAACGQGSNPAAQGGGETEAAGDGEQISLRFAWWGSDHYHEMYQDVVEAFEAEHPEIDIVPEFTDWGSYWDKLATTVAGGDTPDILMQEERYLREYAERGVLADMSEYDISTDAMDEGILASGEVDGARYAIPTGVNVYALAANPRIFEEAGVEMPDDTTWTWDEYVDIANRIGAAGIGVYGMQDHGSNEAGFNVFARQRGESLYSEDGGLGYDDETLAEWWSIALELQSNGGQPSASESVEIGALGPEQTLIATGKGAMLATWTNQLPAIAGAAGEELVLLRWPGESEHDRTGMYFKPALYASMASDTEHPEEAAMFIDFMLNSDVAGDIIKTDLGLPVNLEIRERVSADLPEVDKQAADFVADLGDEIVDGPPVPPVGAGEVATILGRINTEVLFEQVTPEDAATKFRSEVEAVLGQ